MAAGLPRPAREVSAFRAVSGVSMPGRLVESEATRTARVTRLDRWYPVFGYSPLKRGEDGKEWWGRSGNSGGEAGVVDPVAANLVPESLPGQPESLGRPALVAGEFAQRAAHALGLELLDLMGEPLARIPSRLGRTLQ